MTTMNTPDATDGLRCTAWGNPPGAWVTDFAKPPLGVDFDLDLNPSDDPNAGFVYVERDTVDTEAAVFDVLSREVVDGAEAD